MYHSPADVLLKHFIDQGLVSETANAEWQGFANWSPDDESLHDNIVSVHDTAGIGDGRLLRTGESIEHPGILVYVRAQSHGEAHRKAVAIATAIDAIARTAVTLESHDYEIQSATKRPTLNLGREHDGRQRFRLTVNATLTIKELV